VVFEFNLNIILKNKYLNYVIFYLKLINTLTIHVSNSITVNFLLFIKLQRIAVDPTCINARMDTSASWNVAPFQKVTGRLRMVWQASNCVGDVSLLLSLELNTLEFLGALTNKNFKGWSQHVFLALPRNLSVSGRIFLWNAFLLLCQELLKFVQAF